MHFQTGKDSRSLGSDTVALLRVLLFVSVLQVATRITEQHWGGVAVLSLRLVGHKMVWLVPPMCLSSTETSKHQIAYHHEKGEKQHEHEGKKRSRKRKLRSGRHLGP